MDSIASLVAQPSSPQSPQVQGSASGADAASLSALLQQRQGPGQGRPGQRPAPNYEQTVAALHHLTQFHRRWTELLSDPEIGKKNLRPELTDMMADVMGEGLATLPQVMTLLSGFPSEPLAQRQWVQKHSDNDLKAIDMILAQHAAAFPRSGDPMRDGPIPGPSKSDHLDVIGGLMKNYKKK